MVGAAPYPVQQPVQPIYSGQARGWPGCVRSRSACLADPWENDCPM